MVAVAIALCLCVRVCVRAAPRVENRPRGWAAVVPARRFVKVRS